jgi:hypothetical protein
VRFNKAVFALVLALFVGGVAVGQDKDKSLGTIKGKVRVETGTPAGVAVVVRTGEKEVTRVETQKNGDFVVSRLTPGVYGLTFRKTGLSIGTIEDVEVKAGKTRSLGDRLVLTVDEGSLAFLSGSVFNADGRSVPNAKVELSRIMQDGTTKKIDGRVTTETGSFKFRLSPDAARYRVTVKTDGEPVSTDVDIDGAAIYRVALNLPPKS